MPDAANLHAHQDPLPIQCPRYHEGNQHEGQRPTQRDKVWIAEERYEELAVQNLFDGDSVNVVDLHRPGQPTREAVED